MLRCKVFKMFRVIDCFSASPFIQVHFTVWKSACSDFIGHIIIMWYYTVASRNYVSKLFFSYALLISTYLQTTVCCDKNQQTNNKPRFMSILSFVALKRLLSNCQISGFGCWGVLKHLSLVVETLSTWNERRIGNSLRVLNAFFPWAYLLPITHKVLKHVHSWTQFHWKVGH